MNMAILTKPAFFSVLLSMLAVSTSAQEAPGPGFGSPNAVENQVEYDFGETWDAWKENLKDNLGLVLSVDYTAVALTANETFDDKEGTGGIARIFGTLDLFNIENGTLVWKFEHRHAYGSVSPFDFSLGQIGYVGLQEPPFNDTDFRTQNLYWSPTTSTPTRWRARGCIS
jgi:porin